MAVTCPLTGQLFAAIHRATAPPPDAEALTADECAGALPGPVVEAADAPGRALAGRTCSRMRSASRRATFRYCRRPFESVDEMGWHAAPRVGDDHRSSDPAGTIIICESDVALARARDPARLARLGALPARKVLVLGNHDFGPTGTPTETGSDETSMTLVIPEERTLLVTHIPLWRVPAGRVKVHGHVHNHERLRAGDPINTYVEQTGYRPLPP